MARMGRPVVHFEITGKDPNALQDYFHELFGWDYDTSGPVSDAVSDHGSYGFVQRETTEDGTGIPGGVGGGPSFDGHVIFYVGVPDVEAALTDAERLGGTRVLGPVRNPGTELVIGHFTDPDGHLIGVAGAA
jgi:predicted enzyme related to lactoylglutathione lyase